MVIENEVAGEAARDLLRAIYWCPRHPVDMEQTTDDIPWVQVLKEKAPEVCSESIPERCRATGGGLAISCFGSWLPPTGFLMS
jgi:hypothetical protein